MLRSRILLSAFAVAATALAVAAFQPAPAVQDGQMPPMPKPTAEHDKLLEGVGKWEGTLTYYAPEAPEMTMAAKETVEPVGGFWTQSRFECDMGGMPYVGTGCLGYDEHKKKYVGTWVDSMSSHLALMEGEMKGDAIVMRWKSPDMTGQMVSHRSETVLSGDAYTSTFFEGEGAGRKSMVITMKRKSGKPVEAGGKSKQ